MSDEEALRILDAWILAHHEYETMPPRPTALFIGNEVRQWEARRLEIEKRLYDAGRTFRAMCAERGPQLAAKGKQA